MLVPGRTRIFATHPTTILDDVGEYFRNAHVIHARNTTIRQIANMLDLSRFEELQQDLIQLEANIVEAEAMYHRCLEILRIAEEECRDLEQEQLSIILQQQQTDEDIEALINEESQLMNNIQAKVDHSVPEYDYLITEENKIKLTKMNDTRDYRRKMDVLDNMEATLGELEEHNAMLMNTLLDCDVDTSISIDADQDTEILENIIAAKQFAFYWLSASNIQMELQLVDVSSTELHEMEMNVENKRRENDLLESQIGEMKIQNGPVFDFTNVLLHETETLQEETKLLEHQQKELMKQRKCHDEKTNNLNNRLERLEDQHHEIKQMVKTRNDLLFEIVQGNDNELMKEDDKIIKIEQENIDLANQIKLVKARIIVVNKKLAKIDP